MCKIQSTQQNAVIKMQTPLDRPDNSGQISFRLGQMLSWLHQTNDDNNNSTVMPLRPGQGPGAFPELRGNDAKNDKIVVYMSRMTLGTCNHQCAGPSGPPRSEHVARVQLEGRGLRSKNPCVHGAANRVYIPRLHHMVPVNRRRSAGKTGTARTRNRTNGPDMGFFLEHSGHAFDNFEAELSAKSPNSHIVGRRTRISSTYPRRALAHPGRPGKVNFIVRV